jgi:glycosyltransferase involved in cell wall biosynthesis
MTDVTCIVLTHAAYRDKGGSIEHVVLAALSQVDVTLEIVVVQNRCSAAEQARLQSFLDEIVQRGAPVRTFACESSIAGARNHGARFAHGRTLVFLDDDSVLLDRDALSKVASLSDSYSHGYGATRLWTPPQPWFAERAAGFARLVAAGQLDALAPFLGQPDPATRGKQSCRYLMRTFIGCFGFVRTTAFRECGGFPEEFVSYGYEDDAFAALLYATYGDFASLAAIRVAHVAHPCAAVDDGALHSNRALYQAVLQRLGARAFHVGDLLYPEEATPRQVLERFDEASHPVQGS